MRKVLSILLVLSSSILISPPLTQGGGKPLVKILANGMTVILQEDHSAPVVAIQYWVKAGSRTEGDREAGITHLIEHMIFKGTPSRGVGEVAREIESAGGEINAYTTFDYTVYHVVIASRFAGVGLEVLSDAVMNALFDPQELEREKKVVLEELRMREDRPAGKLQKALFAEAFRVHPYRRPIIGYSETVSSLHRRDLLDYVERLYAPDNVILVLVGDLDPPSMLECVESLVKKWPGRPVRLPPVPEEPAQDGLRQVVLREEASEVHMQLVFHIPPARHEDAPALDLLAVMLGVGDSSRLERTVRSEKGLVHSVGAFAYTLMDAGLLWMEATLDPAKMLSAYEAILTETFRLRRELVRSEELEKARINVEADLLRGKETMQGKARTLGYFQAAFGDISSEKAYREAIAAVTREDIQRVARRYLTPDRLTVGILIPPDVAVQIGAADLERIARQAEEAAVPAVQSLATESDLGHVHLEVLENGLKLLVKEDRGQPTVSLRAVFLGGLRFERPSNAGISAFVARMLTRGTRSRSANQLAQEVESMAGSLSGYSGRNSMGVEAEFLSRFFARGMELMADVIRDPTFPSQEVDKERSLLLAALRREKDQPTRLVLRTFAQTLFRVHPYGLRRLGTEASLRSLGGEDLRDYHRRWFKPDNAVLSVVGDVTREEALRWTRRYFGAWEAGGFQSPVVPREPPVEEIRVARRHAAKQQVHIVLGFPGTSLGSPDRFALEVLDTVLSGQGGRLFRELRDRQGLAYSVTSFSQVGLDPGYFGTYIATLPENEARAIAGLKRELERVRQEEILPEELERAKRYIVGSYEIGLQTHASQAMSMALDERYGLGFDYGKRYIQGIQAVSGRDVLRVARKYIRMDRYVLAVVGPEF